MIIKGRSVKAFFIRIGCLCLLLSCQEQESGTYDSSQQTAPEKQYTTASQDSLRFWRDTAHKRIYNYNSSITWWGVMGYEINIQDIILHVDPFFRIHRRGNYVLITINFSDHSSPTTRARILRVSPDMKVMLQPANAPTSPELLPYIRSFKEGDVYEDSLFKVIAYSGYANSHEDLTYLIHDKQTGLWFFHAGDAMDEAYESIRQAFKDVSPDTIDYYLCALGKMSRKKIKSILLDFQPRYLIPGHYPYYIKDITDEQTVVQFPEEGVPYIRPPYSIHTFVGEMNQWIEDNDLRTKVIVVRPGEELPL